jgi:hypothetical protein
MRHLERILVSLDSWPWIAVVRVALGLAIPPVFRVLLRGHDQVWITLTLFIAVLISLRVVPAVIRRILPFSDDARKIWAERRSMAKQHDSYQWQKLVWIGLGLLPYVVFRGLNTGELVVMIVCLVGGAVGLWIWRRSAPVTLSHR